MKMSANVKKHDHIYNKVDSPSSKELKYRRKLYPDVSIIEGRRVQCTVCLKDIKHIVLYKRKVFVHKHLKVLVCKECYLFYEDGDFSVDEDGLDKYCRWCGQGGQLFMCSECPCAFCKKCIKQNLARSAVTEIEDDDWKCYMCNNKPLCELRALCWAVEQHIQNLKQKQSSVKKTEKSKPDIIKNSTASTELYALIQPSNSDCNKLVKKAKNWITDFGSDINGFCTTLKKRIDTSLVEIANLKSARDTDNTVRNLVRIIEQSIQTLSDFKHSVIGYHTNWEKQLKEAVDSYIEVIDCTPDCSEEIISSPEVVYVDERKRSSITSSDNEGGNVKKSENNGSTKKFNNLKNKKTSVNSKEENSKQNDKRKNSETENSTKDTEEVSKTELINENKDGDNNNDTPFVPRIRIKNVDELNGIVKTEDTKEETNKEVENENNVNDTASIILESGDDTENENDTKNKVVTKSSALNSNSVSKKDMLVKCNKINNSTSNNITNKVNNKSIVNSTSSESSDMEVDNSEVQNVHNQTNSELKKNENVNENSSDSSSETLFSSDSSENNHKKKKSPVKKKRNNSESSSNDNKKKPKSKKSILELIDTSEKSSDSSFSMTAKRENLTSNKTKMKKKSETKNEDSAKDGEKNEKPHSTTYFSSSEDDLRKLLNLKSLEKKRKYSSSGSRSSDSSKEKENKKKNSSKKTKLTEKELSLLDCLEGSDDENREEENMHLENQLQLPSLKMNYNNISLAKQLLEVMSHSDADSDASTIELSGNEDQDKTEKNKKKSKKEEKSDTEKKKKGSSGGGSKIKYDKLLKMKLTETDSSEAEEKWRKYKMKEAAARKSDESNSGIDEKRTKVNKMRKKRGKKNARLFSSDSSVEFLDDEGSDSDSSKNKIDSDKEKTPPPKNRRRRRIKAQSSDSDKSTDEDGESKLPDSSGKGRKNIRKVLKEEHLKESTQTALKQEQERKKRIVEKQTLYNAFVSNTEQSEGVKELEEVVLDFDAKSKKTLLALDKNLVKKLKPHQADGIKFMWDACFESLEDSKTKEGSGCILAHCMGLGKSLQVVSLLHTLITKSSETGINTALVVCPVSTVLNWVNEFEKWLGDVGSGQDIEVYHMAKTQTNYRIYQLKDWHKSGGVMVLGYNLYRILANDKIKVKSKAKTVYVETLIDPGPDIVICDEGHLLKNEATAISLAMNKIKTKRRIVLTGTPLQNNLIEYHCMVHFVKPNLLGTKKEFKNRFVHPIQNGQFEDSTAHDVKVMKRRAHVLHTMLDGIVQRKDYNVLTPYLPPKYEYVIHLKMSDLQCTLYRHYLDNEAQRKLFIDFQSLMRICIHPRALLMKSERDLLKVEDDEEESEGSLKDFINDKSDSDGNSSSSSLGTTNSDEEGSRRKEASASAPAPASRRRTRAAVAAGGDVEQVSQKKSEWWSKLVDDDQLEDLRQGSKIFLFFMILKYCEEIGDKLLVFSQSLFTLDVIEFFLNKIDEESQKSEPDPRLAHFTGSWIRGVDYFRMDGGSSFDNRNACCKAFNSEHNLRPRLFLISTRAGGLGINLTGANRVIIFDASWNPSYDVQSLFRVYRFGQSKPCYIYRFLSKGTMEEKIYERQVAKLSTSLRVIDEHQIDRHFSQSSLAELYTFDPEGSELRATPVLPKDRVMAELLQSHGDIILSYHQHDSLLENQEDQELTEEERKAAWTEFENEKQPRPQFSQQMIYINDVEQRLKIQFPNLTDAERKTRALEIFQKYQMIQRQQQFQNSIQQIQHQVQQKLAPQQQQSHLPQQQRPYTVIQPPQKTGSTSSAIFNNAYQPYRFPQGILGQLQHPQFAPNPKAAVAAATVSSSNRTTLKQVEKASTSDSGTSSAVEPIVLND